MDLFELLDNPAQDFSTNRGLWQVVALHPAFHCCARQAELIAQSFGTYTLRLRLINGICKIGVIDGGASRKRGQMLFEPFTF